MQRKVKIGIPIAVSIIIAILLFAPLQTKTTYSYWLREGVGVEDELSPKGLEPIVNVKATIRRSDGTVEKLAVHNVITNVGMNWTQYKMFGDATPDGKARYIALSTDSGGVSDTDSDCPSEIGADGLARANGTDAFDGSVTGGDFDYSVYHNFTYSGASTTVYKSCLMTDDTDGAPDIVLAIALLSPEATLGTNDDLDLQWDIAGTSG